MALPALLGQVHSHLEEVRNDPRKSLNDKLLEHVDRQVTETIEESWRDTLLNQLSDLLPTLQQDPTPVTNLINVLTLPATYDFTRVLTIQPPVDFTAGFTSSLPSINLAVLSLLEKATYRKSDIDIVAGKADVVAALVKLWLCTPDTAVAGRAHDVIVGLLLANEGEHTMSDSGIMDEGLIWRRILRDRDIYGSIFSICSLNTAGQEGPLSKREKTVSQARLLDMLLKIDSSPVRTSQIPEIEQQFGVNNGGLLHFAAIHMVEYQDDVLMHMTLIEFYANYLGTSHTYALHFLRSNGLHDRALAYYLEPEKQDSLDLTYLYGASAKYLSTYCSTFPQDLLPSPLAGHILSRVTQAVENTSSIQWAQGKIPKHDLRVLVSLPRVMLIPRTQASSPLFLIPVKPANPDAFAALAHILHGSHGGKPEERAAARALYYLEMENISTFWGRVVAAADTVALKESALSALSLIGAVITAKWSPLPDTEPSGSTPFRLPSEGELASKCNAASLPKSGIEAIMSQPALGIVVPYLMRPPQSFGNLVSGGRGDVESAVYQIAAAKHDVLTLLHMKLKAWVGTRAEGQEMVAAVERRVMQGAMGGTGEVGGRVGTMES
ncbi:hypothetical protein HO133_009480 [Letharia lupina]|uniref:Uncharacterized protein n=1 Tax=Letharia lupina TaxID=560253 RepID=A0A8H6CKU2_9LECA|nr:uncharacterized protein HO133_009480 [Letharia lupina]KAF6225480.1 hypothetical protein HO133_009480 [Letharia lupina]